MRLALSASSVVAGFAFVFITVTGVEYAPLTWLSRDCISEPATNRPASTASPERYFFVSRFIVLSSEVIHFKDSATY
jgi:hypothetical protein